MSTDIEFDPSVLPESNSERVQNEIALWSIGVRTDEDLARNFNRSKDDDEIAAIVENIRAMRDSEKAKKVSADARGTGGRPAQNQEAEDDVG